MRVSGPNALPSMRSRHHCLSPEPFASGTGTVPTEHELLCLLVFPNTYMVFGALNWELSILIRREPKFWEFFILNTLCFHLYSNIFPHSVKFERPLPHSSPLSFLKLFLKFALAALLNGFFLIMIELGGKTVSLVLSLPKLRH